MPERPAKLWDVVAWALLAPLVAAPLTGIVLFLLAVNFQPADQLCRAVGDACYQLLYPLIPDSTKTFILHAVTFFYPAVLAGNFIASGLAWQIWSGREAVTVMAISVPAQFLGVVLACHVAGPMRVLS